MFIYGSNFCIVTLNPRAFNNLPNDAAVIPFPSPETTPPVTNTYFTDIIPPIRLSAYTLINIPTLFSTLYSHKLQISTFFYN